MRRTVPAFLASLLLLSAAVPAAADRATERSDAVQKYEQALDQHRRERAAIHDEFDAKARELARKRFSTSADRAEAWRKLDDERRVKLDDVDEDFEARRADFRRTSAPR